MRLISILTATTVLTFSYLHNVEAASVTCSGKSYPKVYVLNTPTPSITVGEYTLAADEYNDGPVYQHTAGIYTFSLYRRQNGYWFISNQISEDYRGTATYSDYNDKAFPWETGWKDNAVVLITKAVFMFGAPYSVRSDGKYETNGTMSQGFPVYTRSKGGSTYSLYKTSDGKWYLTSLNPPSESGSTLLYGKNTAFHPWDATFNSSAKVLPLLECDV